MITGVHAIVFTPGELGLYEPRHPTAIAAT
jgi:hypothetical protein